MDTKTENPTIEAFSINKKKLLDIATQWDTLYKQSPTATVFQSREFFEFCTTQKFWTPFAFGVSEYGVLKGIIVGFIQHEGGKIKQFFTRRAIINGGPMLSGDIGDEALSALLKICAKGLKRKAIYIESRNLKDYEQYRDLFRSNNFKYNPHYNFQLPISTEEEPFLQFHKSLKRDLKTAWKRQITVCDDPTIEDVKTFYRILRLLYSTRVKTPLFPWEFFEAAYNNQLFHYTIAKSPQGEVVGGVLLARDSLQTGYEWFEAHDRTVEKTLFPSAVVCDAAIRYCPKSGVSMFDFMGAGSPGDRGYWVRDFKAKFGGTLVEHGRFIRILHYPRYYLGLIVVKIIKRKT